MSPEQRQAGLPSLLDPGRKIAIFTTASLPWRTGTAVNPLLRAAYLQHELREAKVTLVLPWLVPGDQHLIFPDELLFKTPEEQGRYVREWVDKRTGFPTTFAIKFYPAHYDQHGFCSIFPVGDITNSIDDAEAEVAVLEEPEHLTWFHHGRRLTAKFQYVVGVMHTNYIDYVGRQSVTAAAVIRLLNRRLCNIHTHKVIKLSDAVQNLPRQTTCFCHGVGNAFLQVGDEAAAWSPAGVWQFGGHRKAAMGLAESSDLDASRFARGAYFIGKGVWGKGYTELLDLLAQHQARGGDPIPLDVYGAGEDMASIQERARLQRLALHFEGAIDHADAAIHGYRVFVNPSTSDVVATTTAEALAMGKWVVVADHPSNAFFRTFANCLVYSSPQQFSERLVHALEHDPAPLVGEDRRKLTWEDATQRFIAAAEPTPADGPGLLANMRNWLTWPIFNASMGIEVVRRVVGAGRNTAQNPENLLDFDPHAPQGRDDHITVHLKQGYTVPRLL